MKHPSFPEVRIVGMHFRSAEMVEYASALQGGEELSLEREPENQFDQNAIKVLTDGGAHLGYIERGQAAWISGHMEEGANYVAVVDRVVPFKNTIHVVCNVEPR